MGDSTPDSSYQRSKGIGDRILSGIWLSARDALRRGRRVCECMIWGTAGILLTGGKWGYRACCASSLLSISPLSWHAGKAWF